MCCSLSVLWFALCLFLFCLTLPNHIVAGGGHTTLTSKTALLLASDISKQTEGISNQQNIDWQKLALDREKFEFEKQQRNDPKSFFNQYLGVIVTATASLLAAFIAAVISYTQIKTSNIAKSIELDIIRVRNQSEDDRQWRLSVLTFIEKHQEELFSSEPAIRDRVILFMQVSFPLQYTSPLLNKLDVLSAQLPKTEQREIKERVLNELLSPLYLEFERTRGAFERWTSKNLYLEAEVIRKGNLHIRDLLLQKTHLIPPQLRADAVRLVEHYDVWLEAFNRLRGGKKPVANEPFVFVGPAGFPFPVDAEQHFLQTYHEYMQDLGRDSASMPNAVSKSKK